MKYDSDLDTYYCEECGDELELNDEKKLFCNHCNLTWEIPD